MELINTGSGVGIHHYQNNEMIARFINPDPASGGKPYIQITNIGDPQKIIDYLNSQTIAGIEEADIDINDNGKYISLTLEDLLQVTNGQNQNETLENMIRERMEQARHIPKADGLGDREHQMEMADRLIENFDKDRADLLLSNLYSMEEQIQERLKESTVKISPEEKIRQAVFANKARKNDKEFHEDISRSTRQHSLAIGIDGRETSATVTKKVMLNFKQSSNMNKVSVAMFLIAGLITYYSGHTLTGREEWYWVWLGRTFKLLGITTALAAPFFYQE